jgi:hypothetical protein
MPQCQFPIFCYFCVSEKLHRKYSWNWMKQKPNIQIFNEASREPKRRRSQTRRWSHHQGHGPGPGRAALWWGPTGPLLTLPLFLWRPPDGKNLKTRSLFQKHIAVHRHRWPEIGRVQKLFPAPYRRGKSPPEVFFIAMLASSAMSE